MSKRILYLAYPLILLIIVSVFVLVVFVGNTEKITKMPSFGIFPGLPYQVEISNGR